MQIVWRKKKVFLNNRDNGCKQSLKATFLIFLPFFTYVTSVRVKVFIIIGHRHYCHLTKKLLLIFICFYVFYYFSALFIINPFVNICSYRQCVVLHVYFKLAHKVFFYRWHYLLFASLRSIIISIFLHLLCCISWYSS